MCFYKDWPLKQLVKTDGDSSRLCWLWVDSVIQEEYPLKSFHFCSLYSCYLKYYAWWKHNATLSVHKDLHYGRRQRK